MITIEGKRHTDFTAILKRSKTDKVDYIIGNCPGLFPTAKKADEELRLSTT